ncbi:MAG: ABC transporter substrate-binding protein [Lachnospiraceae bacterium]|nr:ABC transporter substrate-binding protein [Lachnospiraceae bacterium]
MSLTALGLAACDYSAFTTAAPAPAPAAEEAVAAPAAEAEEAAPAEEAEEDVQEAEAPAAEGQEEAESAGTEKQTVRIMALKGPTAMGMVKLMDEASSDVYDDADYQFSIVGAVDEVPPAIVKGETDIAAVPANLAAVLYNNTEGAVEVLAVNTLGVLYIVENGDSVSSVEDLRGKTIYASGKGATPEYGLNYILNGYGIDPETDVTIEWKSEHAECLAAILADEGGIAMLPQPFVTTAQMQNEGIRTALDLTAEWDALQEGKDNASSMLTGVVIARRAFVEENPEAVSAFMDRYAASVSFVNENNDEAAALVGGFEIVPEAVAKKALPACNIVFIEGEELKQKLGGYLEVLMEQNPQAVGGALPAEDFYYSR